MYFTKLFFNFTATSFEIRMKKTDHWGETFPPRCLKPARNAGKDAEEEEAEESLLNLSRPVTWAPRLMTRGAA